MSHMMSLGSIVLTHDGETSQLALIGGAGQKKNHSEHLGEHK